MKNEKKKINAYIDGDIYDELKRRADLGEGRGRYQTLMNEILREALFPKNDKPDLEKRIEVIEKALKIKAV